MSTINNLCSPHLTDKGTHELLDYALAKECKDIDTTKKFTYKVSYKIM